MLTTDFHIALLKLTNFKGYTYSAFEFAEKLNFIVGNNGIGKTNLLDAVYYSCLTKSYLSADGMVPNFENNFFRIESIISFNADNQLIEIKYIKQEKKDIFVNKSKVEKQSAYIGKFPCVIITPDDNQLILGGSELRRKFIDATLCQLSEEYLTNLMHYNKILAQRNALLKSFYERNSFDKNLLEVYNQKLFTCGQYIFNQRKLFLEKFIPLVKDIYSKIFEGQEHINIIYDSCLLEKDFEQLLQDTQEQDRMAMRTTKGIHTDDLQFELNHFPIKKIGSQGQQKTFLLSLKIAQYKILQQEKKVNPLLLLDDIFDKLDEGRIKKIFKLIHEEDFGQVFITDTDEASILSIIQQNAITQYKIIRLGK